MKLTTQIYKLNYILQTAKTNRYNPNPKSSIEKTLPALEQAPFLREYPTTPPYRSTILHPTHFQNNRQTSCCSPPPTSQNLNHEKKKP